jgi:hypothetical protein
MPSEPWQVMQGMACGLAAPWTMMASPSLAVATNGPSSVAQNTAAKRLLTDLRIRESFEKRLSAILDGPANGIPL